MEIMDLKPTWNLVQTLGKVNVRSYAEAADGFVIEIKGKDRATVAMCAALNLSDAGKGIIRLEGLTRNNATAWINDTVVARRMRALQAEK